MKVILQDNNYFVLRFDKDEKVFQGLIDFMTAQNCSACSFVGIGTASTVEVGYYNPHLKDYRKKPYVEDLEIVSLTGNGSISSEDNKPAIHAHGVVSRNDFTTLGGHFFEITVGATVEISLTKLNGKINRKKVPELNLNLLD